MSLGDLHRKQFDLIFSFIIKKLNNKNCNEAFEKITFLHLFF